MRRLGLIAAAVGLLVALQIQITEADHNVFLPAIPTTVMSRVMDTGRVTYALDTGTSGYPNFRNQARDVVQAAQDMHGIPAFEVSLQARPDIILTMPPDDTFIGTCGAQAAGCITYWADPIVIYFRRALLYNDWKTTISHEGINGGHAFGQHERYFDSFGRFACDVTATYTVMSCGTGVWRLTEYDRLRVLEAFAPDVPSARGFVSGDGWACIGWGQNRGTNDAYTTPLNVQARRMAFAWLPPGGDRIQWVGEVTTPFTSPMIDGQRCFDGFWRGCLYARAENENWFLPEQSAPDHWFWWGCF